MISALRLPLSADKDVREAQAVVLDFDQLYEENFDYVWRTARRLGAPSSSVDDVVQDVFVVLHRRLAQFTGGAVRPWIFVVVRNVVRDVRRALRRKPGNTASEDGELFALLADPRRRTPEDITSANESLRLVELLLESVGDEKREILVLTEFDGLTAPEIAETLSIPVNTVYSRLRAAREEFATAWEQAEARVQKRTER